MKHIVHSTICGKLQLISHLTSSPDDPEWSIIVWLEFLCTTLLESGLPIWLQHEVNHIIYLKTMLSPLLVCIILFLVLSSRNVVPYSRVIGGYPTITQQKIKEIGFLINIKSHEGCHLYSHMVCSIVAINIEIYTSDPSC